MHLLQAVFTNSVFVLDWNRPAPLTEFFVPAMPELHFPEFRDCVGASTVVVTELCLFCMAQDSHY